MAFNLELSVSRFTLDGATIAMDGNVSTNLELDARQAGSFEDKTELFAIEFTPITVPPGPVPLVFRPRVPIVLGWDGQVSVVATTSATTSTATRVGVGYDGGDWKKIAEFTADHHFNPPALDAADPTTATVYAGPRFEFRLWEELAVASVGVEGTVRLELLGETPWACLYAGARAPATIEVIGDTVVDGRLFEFEELLVPDECQGGLVPPDAITPVAGYSRSLGTCAPEGGPVGEFGRRVAALDDGGVVVAAATTEDMLWVVRLDAAGDVVWERRYPNRTLGRAVTVVPADEQIVVGLGFGSIASTV